MASCPSKISSGVMYELGPDRMFVGKCDGWAGPQLPLLYASHPAEPTLFASTAGKVAGALKQGANGGNPCRRDWKRKGLAA